MRQQKLDSWDCVPKRFQQQAGELGWLFWNHLDDLVRGKEIEVNKTLVENTLSYIQSHCPKECYDYFNRIYKTAMNDEKR